MLNKIMRLKCLLWTVLVVAVSVTNAKAAGVYASRQPSTLTTNQTTLRESSHQAFGLISQRVLSMMGATAETGTSGTAAGQSQETIVMNEVGTGPKVGMASGNQGTCFGAWGIANYSNFKDTDVSTAQKANVYTAALGFDYKITSRFLAGLAYVYNDFDAKTPFNQGRVATRTSYVMPYAVFRFNKYFSMDSMLGFGWTHKDIRRTDLVNGGGNEFLADTNSRQYLASLFLNAQNRWQDFTALLRVGYTYVTEKQDAFSEKPTLGFPTSAITSPNQKTDIGTALGLVRVGYVIQERFEPFLQGGVDYDTTLTKVQQLSGTGQVQAANNKTGYSYGGGVNLFGCGSWTGGLQYMRNQGHSKITVNSYTINVRYAF